MNSFFTSKPLKQAINDSIVTLPYVLTDTVLYFSTAVEFLDLFLSQDTPANKWKRPPYIILIVLIFLLAITYFCTFSSTNGKLFKVDENNSYSRAKNNIRRALGIPSAVLKTSIGTASFYMFLREKLPLPSLWILSGISLLCGLPPMIALLWSKHKTTNQLRLLENSEISNRGKFKRILKYLFIHSTTMFYSIDNTSIYFWGTINLPKKLGIVDHDLSIYKNGVERFFYYFSYFICLFPFIGVHIAYSHLNENMFDLIEAEDNRWTIFKDKTKKLTGPVASITKVTNAAVSNYSFFSKKLPLWANIPFSIAGGISGLITQYSILAADPIRKEKLFSSGIETELSEESENEVIPLETFPMNKIPELRAE